MMSLPCKVLVCSISITHIISSIRNNMRLKKRRTKSIKLRTYFRSWEFSCNIINIILLNSFLLLNVLSAAKCLVPLLSACRQVRGQGFYFIKNGILAIFLSAIPVPRTTARSGSSATCTGSLILCDMRLSSPRSNAPPPVRYRPRR